MKNYDTVSEAVSDLNKRGYTRNFNLDAREERLVCNKSGLVLSPEDFEVDEVHRFEGIADAGDEMIVFALSNKYLKAKGTLVNAYGIYADLQTSRIVQRLSRHL